MRMTPPLVNPTTKPRIPESTPIVAEPIMSDWATKVAPPATSLRLPLMNNFAPMVHKLASNREATLLSIGTRMNGCLLYTSDAADEEDSVDLGGRRIIK